MNWRNFLHWLVLIFQYQIPLKLTEQKRSLILQNQTALGHRELLRVGWKKKKKIITDCNHLQKVLCEYDTMKERNGSQQ